MARFHSKMAHSLPKMWLFTDERVTRAALMAALVKLPRGSGVIFRHYSLADAERRDLFQAVRKIARRRQLVLLLAGDARLAQSWGADGWHGRSRKRLSSAKRNMLHSMAVHNAPELARAWREQVDVTFLSPVFPTRSHPGQPALGTLRFALLCHQARMPVMALGGMTRHQAKRIIALGAAGWGAIDSLSGFPLSGKAEAVRT